MVHSVTYLEHVDSSRTATKTSPSSTRVTFNNSRHQCDNGRTRRKADKTTIRVLIIGVDRHQRRDLERRQQRLVGEGRQHYWR